MLKKDLIELCLLHLLSQGDQYGYEILSRLHEAFPDTQESAVYALLRKLCKDGYSENYQGRQSEGPPRKYYRLTPSGDQKRQCLLEEWRSMREAITALGIE
ncbi:MAG: PadR family transcriptional regulator [Oscillibacter sp.]|nr:PadR family transcriptional regulator [Oscillibacter sp.]